MSNVLIVLSSETWGSLKEMVREQGYTIQDTRIWGGGRPGETLQQFLDKHLSEMVYDENVHIITEVTKVETKTRCPYPRGKYHETCGWIPCAVCGRGDWAHPDVFGIEPHEYAPEK